jgi:DNA polymerase|tara:strand:+ start:1080 stop:2972 length:1893 start_codon:yes stop_codon:yes gene_type:complete
MPKILRVDFETRSTIDLPKRGVHIYAADPSTDAWCMAYAFDDEPVELWVMGEDLPASIREHIEGGGLLGAWNASFELAIWNHIMVPRNNWPHLFPEQCRCTMMMAGAMSLPLGLDRSAGAVSLGSGKDQQGYSLMLRMAKPRKLDPLTWWDVPARKEKLYAYCKQDVEVERNMAKKLRPLSDKEQALWVLDQEINNRGIPIDMDRVEDMIQWCKIERIRLDKAMHKVTKGRVKDCSDLVGLKAFADVTSVAKEPLNHHIENSEGRVLEALTLRRDFAKTSTKKLDAFMTGTMDDKYMRGIFQFYGASSTGRWAGRRVQPQNFPRPTCPQDEIERRINEQDFRSLQEVSDCLRGMIAAPEGEQLVCADFSAIEARALGWLAGEQKVLDAFIEGLDLYKVAAADIYGVAYEDVSKDQRQVGKVAILALGYQGAKGAFNAMASGYGVKLKDAQVEKIVAAWREANQNIVNWWYDLERAAMKAIKSTKGEKIKIGGTLFRYKGGHLWMKIPSGRLMCFPRAKISSIDKPWGKGTAITYMGENSYTHKVERLSTYGGKLAENITQAVARDLLAEAMVRVEAAGYRVCMHVHDEIVAPLHEGGSLKEFEDIMAEVPTWAEGLPLAAEGWVGRRYRK